ncbi:MAG: hypothetical protein HON42_02200, partial [Alphaproteobacteria bacterium]|nr:hypothetical protein [Alphaproteobacteria bacterium]
NADKELDDNLLQGFDLAVLHRCFNENSIRSAYYLKKNNIPYLLDINDNFFVKGYLDFKGDMLVSNMKQLSKNASGFVAATENIKNLITQNINPECPIHVAKDMISDFKGDLLGEINNLKQKKEIDNNSSSNVKSSSLDSNEFLSRRLYALVIIRIIRSIIKTFYFLLDPVKPLKRLILSLQKKADNLQTQKTKKPQYCKSYLEKKILGFFLDLESKLSKPLFLVRDNLVKENNTESCNNPKINFVDNRPKVIWYGASGANRKHGNFGIKSLLIAMPDLIELNQEKEYDLLIVSENLREYEKYFNKVPIHSHFIKWDINTIEDLVKSSDVTIIPNYIDDFTLAKGINRAEFSFYCDTPVVATRLPNLEIFKNCMEFDNFKLGIKKYLFDKDKARKDVMNAKKIISENYSKELLVEKIESVFIDTCKNYKKTIRLLALINIPQDADIILSLYNYMEADTSIDLKLACVVDTLIGSSRIIEFIKNNNIRPVMLARDENIAEFREISWNQIDALITSSETNAAYVHKIAHNITSYARKHNILTFTMQHGLENIGLNYLDNRFNSNVKFASDYIFIWGKKENIFPEFGDTMKKVISVGKLKHHEISKKQLPDLGFKNFNNTITIFENLHWERYDDNYKKLFLNNIKLIISKYKNVLFLIKPHHTGKFIINYEKDFGKFRNCIMLNPDNAKYEPFTAPSLMNISCAVITTPSTVSIDALLAKKALAVVQYNLDLPIYKHANVILNQSGLQSFVAAVTNNNKDYLKKIEDGNSKFLANNLVSTDAVSNITTIIKNKIYEKNFKDMKKQPVFAFRSDNFEITKYKAFVICQNYGATAHISFVSPLLRYPTNDHGVTIFDSKISEEKICFFIEKECPDVVIISREYIGSLELVFSKARQMNIPLIFHLDDDLFNIPEHIGERYFKYFNQDKIKNNLHYCVQNSDIIYASNRRLKKTLQMQFANIPPIFAGDINASFNILNKYVKKDDNLTIGYYGSASHQKDFDMAQPHLKKILEGHKNVKIEIIGEFTLLKDLFESFCNRITIYPKIQNYEHFISFLSKRNWDIGLIFLSDQIKFNNNVSNLKWCEYTACGIPVIASNHNVYVDECADECGLLVDDNEWYGKISQL